MSKSKPIDFATYKKIQKMPLNTFNHWLMDLCSDVYDDGFNYATQNAVEVTDEKLMDILLSVKGIGQNRAEQVLQKILQENQDGIKVRRNNEKRQ